jgi:hypothetical protein
MMPAPLLKYLIDLSPEQWCRSLNRRGFFWPTTKRLASHLGATLDARHPRIVFSFQTRTIFDILDFNPFEFPAINSGNTMRKAAPRGSATFLKAKDHPFQEQRKRRGLGDAVAEVTYPYGVASSQLALMSLMSMTSEIVLG